MRPPVTSPPGRVRWLRRRWALALVLALALAWLAGLVWFAETIARPSSSMPAADERPTDAIVVLTGGSERLTTGLELLGRGLASTVFVSGVHQGVGIGDLLRASRLPPDQPADRLADRLECCVVLGYAAGDTAGNAAETAAWMRARGYRSLRLVTANYHMRRSLLEFRMMMPDLEIVPHPVMPDSVRVREWWRWPGTASLILGEYHKFLFTALRYWLTVR
ncbi:MAG TPA: YdcF family protein [Arenibaculum sp.]|nr:YdcF family protein [Arenibaculum sp.]